MLKSEFKIRLSFPGLFLKMIRYAAVTIFFFMSFLLQGLNGVCQDTRIKKEGNIKLLEDIYREIVELGPYNNDSFIKREFHIELDGRGDNKEEHVVVLIQKFGGKERMLLQVTYFKPEGKSLTVKHADKIKIIMCSRKDNKMRIEECDFSDRELKIMLSKMLQGIKNKKELLKLIKKKSNNFDSFIDK